MLRLLNHRHYFSSLPASKFTFSPSSKLHGFKHLSSVTYEDSNVHLHHFEHQKTNSHFYHLQNQDSNNCFAPIVKTLIDNNKGTPHILEHLVCCGSHNYPIRDPFMNMIRRSLNTYMNAWTGQDFTAYPFSTANGKDFNNLLKVYSDMVFKPNLDYFDFRQQGWRYETGEKGAQYKGIVLNQMKGVYQSPQRQLWLEVNRNLFRGTPYEFDTGGQPKQIVNLEYEELKHLFNKYYHPSNMSFYSYGNSDFTKTLDFLNSSYLQKYDKLPQSCQIKSPLEPVRESTIYCKQEDSQILFSCYLGQLEQIPNQDLVSLGLLSYLLFESNQSPIYEQLIQSGYGDVYTDIYGLQANKLVTFSFGLKGVDIKQKQFRSKIFQILTKVKNQGFNNDLLEQAIIQTQISSIFPSKNKGIKMLEKLLGVINHRGDIGRLLSYKSELAKAKQQVRKKQYRQQLIDKYLMKNQNYTIVLQEPSQKIEQYVLTPPEKLSFTLQKIKEEQQTLLKRQLDPMNKSILPTLQLQDINKEPPKYTIIRQSINKIPLSIVQTPKGLTYIKTIFNLPSHLPLELYKLIDIWIYVINKGISTNKLSYKELSKQVSLCSNGIHVSYGNKVFTQQPFVQFSITCLDETVSTGVTLLGQFIRTMKFQDSQNLKTLFKGYQNEFRNDIIQNPFSYAVSTAINLVQNIPNNKGKFIQGLQGYIFAEDYLNQKITSDPLLKLSKEITSSSPSIILHSNTSNDIPDLKNKIFQALDLQNPNQKEIQHMPKKIISLKSLSFTQNYDVNYCVASLKGPKSLTKQAAQVSIFLELLQQQYLHKKIREQGGAYGSGAKLQNQVIYLYSYADPQGQRTFTVFSESIQSLLNSSQKIQQEDIKQCKLSIFGRIDQEPVDYERGMNEIINGIAREQLQKYREWVRDASLKNIVRSASKYLKNQEFHRIIFGKDVPSGFKEIKINFDDSEETLNKAIKGIQNNI